MLPAKQFAVVFICGVKPPPPTRWQLALFYFVVVGPRWLTFYIKPKGSANKLASEVAAAAKSTAAMDEVTCQYLAFVQVMVMHVAKIYSNGLAGDTTSR